MNKPYNWFYNRERKKMLLDIDEKKEKHGIACEIINDDKFHKYIKRVARKVMIQWGLLILLLLWIIYNSIGGS